MARRRMRVADVKEILVHWDGGGTISGIAAALGYSRPTVRKYESGKKCGRQLLAGASPPPAVAGSALVWPSARGAALGESAPPAPLDYPLPHFSRSR